MIDPVTGGLISAATGLVSGIATGIQARKDKRTAGQIADREAAKASRARKNLLGIRGDVPREMQQALLATKQSGTDVARELRRMAAAGAAPSRGGNVAAGLRELGAQGQQMERQKQADLAAQLNVIGQTRGNIEAERRAREADLYGFEFGQAAQTEQQMRMQKEFTRPGAEGFQAGLGTAANTFSALAPGIEFGGGDNKTTGEKGGTTKGKFSHDSNPLTVVDKNGEDTGMELTGNEDVFTKSVSESMRDLVRGKGEAKKMSQRQREKALFSMLRKEYSKPQFK